MLLLIDLVTKQIKSTHIRYKIFSICSLDDLQQAAVIHFLRNISAQPQPQNATKTRKSNWFVH